MENEIDFKLNGLNCAHCAEKIEEKVKNLDNVEYAFLNFMKKEIKIKLKDVSEKYVIAEKITDIVKKIEPGVNVSEIIKKDFS